MAIWEFAGRRATLGILLLTGLAGLLGYVNGGTNSAAVYAAIAFVAVGTTVWLWATLESYTERAP